LIAIAQPTPISLFSQKINTKRIDHLLPLNIRDILKAAVVPLLEN
jgi:hypothetical protein